MTPFEFTESLTRDLPFPVAELAGAPTRIILIAYPVAVRLDGSQAVALSVRWKAAVAASPTTENARAQVTGFVVEPSAVYWHPSEAQLAGGASPGLLPLDLARDLALLARVERALDDAGNATVGAPVITDHGDYPNFGPAPAIPGTVLPDQTYDLPDGTEKIGEGNANSTRPDALDLWPPGSGKPSRFLMVTTVYAKHTPICDFDSGATWLLPSQGERLSCVRARDAHDAALAEGDDNLIYFGRHRSVCPAATRFGDRTNFQLFVVFQTEAGALLAESQDDGANWTISDLGLHDCRPLACGLDGDGNPFLLVLALGLESAARSYLPFTVVAVKLGRTGDATTPDDFRDDSVPDSLGDREFPPPPFGEKTPLPPWQIVSLKPATGVPIGGARPNFAPLQNLNEWVSVDYHQNYPGEYLEELILFNENRAPLNRARFEIGWQSGGWTLVASNGPDLQICTSLDGIDWHAVGVALTSFQLIGSARDSAGRLHIMARRINRGEAAGAAPDFAHIRAGDVAAITFERDGDELGSDWALTQIERATGLPVLLADKNVLAYYGSAWTVRAQVNDWLRVWRSTDGKLTWEEVRAPRDLP